MTHPFKARSIHEAWKKGCGIMNRACPSKKGRLVYLSLHEMRQPQFVTQYIKDQMKLPAGERYFSNVSDLTAFSETTVAYGLSKQKLIAV